ncbi:MAG: NAD-dependent epimerase/dehydratase family protein, partial [Acidimicrobiia bacterium]
MKVVVTGAAGFLGRHIARGFRDSGAEVVGFDLESFQEPGIESVTGDLTAAQDVAAAVAGASHVAHAGAIGDVYLAGERPELAAAVNVVGTANVIAAAKKTGARLVYASTWEVYGEPIREPIEESHPTMPDHPYNITKLAGESLVLAATRLEGLEAVALRLGTAYGSGLRPNSVFRIFIDRARAGQTLTIQGDGAQGRQFTHASDIARAFQIAARSEVSGMAFNIVGPEIISIKELAETVARRFGTVIEFGEPRPGDVPSALVSAKRAQDVLGWKAEMPFEKGLDELID